MGVQQTTRVIRGGRAVETMYWHFAKKAGGGPMRFFKHGRTLVIPKKSVPVQSESTNVAQQALKKIR